MKIVEFIKDELNRPKLNNNSKSFTDKDVTFLNNPVSN